MRKRSLLFSVSVLVATLFVERVQANRAGPPADTRFDEVCTRMLPAGHGTLEEAQPGSGGYLIGTNLPLVSAQSGYRYTAGQTYTGKIIVKLEPALTLEWRRYDRSQTCCVLKSRKCLASTRCNTSVRLQYTSSLHTLQHRT